MFFNDPKKTASAILSKVKGPEETPAPETDEEEGDSLDAATDDVMQAFADKDREGLKAALRAFVELCGTSDDE